ncbi:MAG: hypothetical protein CSA62_11490 [Planctomycetota bacterium]|nr:MAG: hypothetical protein CSA62_11490 [Planctomycetota bacterium]
MAEEFPVEGWLAPDRFLAHIQPFAFLSATRFRMPMFKLPALLLSCLLLPAADALQVDFEKLSDFEFVEGMELPESIQKLDGKVIRIGGFPRTFDGQVDEISEFWLISQNCDCEGVPFWNEMMWCTLTNGQTITINDEPLVLEGKLSVGEDRDEEYLLSLYRLTVTKIVH